MSSIRMPYQCMIKNKNTIFAASGSTIDSYNLQNGSLLSSLKFPTSQPGQELKSQTTISTPALTKSESSSVEIELDASSPPAKKRKLSEPATGNEKQGQKQGKRKQNNRSSEVASGLEAPAVIAFAVTKSGQHVIAVTGEDKSIRVFENITESGVQQLKQLSKRSMPKRPCAVALTEDESTIISADKFGDVFSLPLLYDETKEAPPSKSETPEPTAAKPFIPAANELTIHSKRNLQALENQRKFPKNRPAEKSEPVFQYKALLGHVSMLTDLALVNLEGRNYILTSDRDEHIRVSRGIPQTHIIEGFCLGHTEFVSRLCIPEPRPNVLISGGGDDELFVWDWVSGAVLSKTSLRSHVVNSKRDFNTEEKNHEDESLKIAVSGIYHTRYATGGETQDLVISTVEGIPALFTFTLTSQNQLEFIQAVKLDGNVLALMTGATNDEIIVSVDTVHKPGSTTERRDDSETQVKALQVLHIQDGLLVQSSNRKFDVPSEGYEMPADGSAAVGKLSNLLYNFENLRKREGDGQDD